MVALVTQDEALRQLRLRTATISAEELLDVLAKADMASAIIVDYLKRPWPDALPPADQPSPFAPTESPLGPMPAAPYTPPTWTPTTTPVLVKAAILIVLTSLYDGRTPDDDLLSGPVKAILERMRDPALA